MAKRLKALLPVVRWIVIGLAGAILVISIIGLFRFPEYAVRHLDEFTPNLSWTGAQVQQGLVELGWPPMSAAWFELIQDLFGLVLIYSISAAILWKKSHDWFGLFLIVVFIINGPIGGIMFKPVLEGLPGLNFFINNVLGAISWQLFFLLFFFFPTGRPVPFWGGWFVAGYSVFMLAAIVVSELNKSQAGAVLGTLMVVLAIGSQIYRYLRRADIIQRQQTKWVVTLLGFFLLLLPVLFLFGFKPPSAGSLGPVLLKDFGFNFLARLVFWLTPVAITIAVLRYRLWDIDLVIRRTLSYGVITAILALIYLGGVTLFQQILTSLTGQNSPAAVVLSTLLIAALFTPLRRRVQTTIDRRFYRQKVDAARALEEFSAASRAQVDLAELTGQLENLVQETVQPESVALWLRKDR